MTARVVTYVHLADTREEAFEQARHGAVRDVHNYFYTINTPRSWLVHPDQNPADLTFEEIVEKRRWIIGTPDDAIEQIEELVEETGGIGGFHADNARMDADAACDVFAGTIR